MRRAGTTVACLAALLCSAASHAALVRVGIFRVTRPNTVAVSCPAGLRMQVGDGKAQTIRGSQTVRVSLRGRSLLFDAAGRKQTAQAASFVGIGARPISIRSDRHAGRYRGTVRVSQRRGRLLIVNAVSLEDYVRGVLPNEMRSDWPNEALRAQAIVARTVALERMGSHAHEGFDLCDTTHCQVYRGAFNETPETNGAVAATAGLVLMSGAGPVKAFYCSTCGGMTTDSMGQKLAGGNCTRTQSDNLNGKAACADSPHFRWSRRISSPDLATALDSDKRTRIDGRVSNLTVISRDKSGRASVVRIDGRKQVTCDGYVFWNVVCRKLGWGTLKSAAFTVKKSTGGFEFAGKGLGHGVGMCQWGAKKRAESGWDFHRILGFYYPGAGVRRFSQASMGVAHNEYHVTLTLNLIQGIQGPSCAQMDAESSSA